MSGRKRGCLRATGGKRKKILLRSRGRSRVTERRTKLDNAAVNVHTALEAAETIRPQLLGLNVSASSDGSISLRRSKRSRNEARGSENNDGNIQRRSSKRVRLQSPDDGPSASAIPTLTKTRELSRTLRSHSKVSTNKNSRTKVIIRSSRKEKMKANSSPLKKNPLSNKTIQTRKNASLNTKADSPVQKGNVRPVIPTLQKSKTVIKTQLDTVGKKKVKVADENNNEATKSKKLKVKRKSKELNQDKEQGKVTKRKSRNRLDPKPFVTEYLEDPTFYSREPIPHISTFANSRLLIRAVFLDDNKLLEELINDSKSICSFLVQRSVNIDRNAFSYALERGNIRAMELLMDDTKIKSLGHFPTIILSEETTGSNSTYMFGHAVRSVTVGRGGREGNNALLKDKYNYSSHSVVKANISGSEMEKALGYGLSISTFQEITTELTGNTWETVKEMLIESVIGAIRTGRHQIAGELVKAAVEKEGYGFNKLHQEVLLNTTEHLTPFKSVSVIKKPHYSPRITPLHCVCINPNPEYLTELLKSNPVYDVADQDKWLPIHYAAVCSGKGPLEVLLSRGVSINQYTKEGESPLHLAASLGRVENVELLLAHQAKNLTAETLSQSLLERKTKAGNSPLHLAVQEGKLEVVKCLLRGGANLNRFTPAQFGKMNPLMIAAQRGHLDILKFLIENDAKIEAMDNRGRTALMHAVIDGQAHIVSYLLRLGANHKAMDSSLNTMVHYAAAYGWYFNLKLLLEAGCPLNEENAWKMTPLVIAFSKGHMGIVEFILGKCEVNINSIINDKNGMTLLLQTCAGNPGEEYNSKIKFLVEQQKADATIADFNNNNALHFVVLNEAKLLSVKHENSELQKSIFDVAKLLIDRGCNPLAKNSENISPVLQAFNRRCFLLTNKFLEWGYSMMEEKDFQQNNFLHTIGTFLDSAQAVQLYKSCSENPKYLEKMKDMANVANADGYPPLLYLLLRTGHVTDKEHKANIFEYLLFLINILNADITAVDLKERSIFHMLIDVNYMEEALALILPLYSDLEVENYEKLTPLALAISNNKEHVAILLVNAGANVNIKFPDGNSLLIRIGTNDNCSLNFLRLILRKGANIHDVNRHTGNTILHYIVRKPNQHLAIETVEELIEAGIDVNASNKDGRTALHLVVNSRGGEIDSSYEIEKLLIRAGANLGIRDNRGRLPLHMAFVKIGKHTDRSFIDPIELVAFLVGAMKDSVQNFAEDIVKGDDFGATPLHYAAFRGASICCSYLSMLMDGHKDALDSNGNTPFGLAVLNGHEGCSLQFKQLGADFSLLLYPEHVANTKASNIIPDYQWNYIKYKGEESKRVITVPKHPIIEEVIRKDWQGILYLTLESLNTSGVGCSLAIASAIRTTRMKLADKLVDQALASELKTKDGNSLLHTLGEYKGGEVNLVKKIAKSLVLKGLSTVELNADGCTPLILPAINRNELLCQLLTELTSEEDQALFNTFDRYGRNAVNALFWTLDGKTVITENLKIWAENLMKLGVSANTRCAFPIELQSFPSVSYLRRDSQLQHSKQSTFNYTPLIFAVVVGNHDAVKWLLTLKSPNFIDINGTDYKGRTALMHAVRLNDIKMVKLLLDPFAYEPSKDFNPWLEQDSLDTEESSKETESTETTSNKLSFSIRDKQGWTVGDYLVASFENFYFEKANMILKLLRSRVLLQQKSGDGLSPLDRAIKLNRIRLIKAIEDMLGIHEEKRIEIDPFKNLYQSTIAKSGENFVEDCQKMTKLILEEEKLSKDSENVIATPDPVLVSSDTTKEYTVIVEENGNAPYNCSLVHVDLSYGTYGLHNFYKMQVVEQERGTIKLILLFTRWGRMGDTGQFQKTPFPNKEEAIKEFKKVFRAKTGNSWENLNEFVAVDKKYRLVNEESKPSCVKIDFALFKNTEHHPPPENANEDIIKLMTAFYRPHSEVKYDSSFTRGSLTRETYQRGEEILGKIAALVQSKAASNKRENDPEIENQTKAIEMLSEEYYSLIPGDNFSTAKIQPIVSESDIRRRQEWIHRLIHLNLASQIILGAQYRLSHHNTNPFEYIYMSLNTGLQVLEPNSEDAQLILEYVHNSCDNYRIKKIYNVERFGEPERFKSCGVGNPWLLWHGTDNVNLLSIFQSGLQVAPFGTRLNGDLFGRGIYFSDQFSKSARYCRGHYEKYVFLCEVALGKAYPVKYEYTTGLEKRKGPPTGCHSLKTSNSLWEPDPSTTIIWKERTVPLGRPTKNPLLWTEETNKGGLNYNEYIIFNENQVILRYLIEFV